MEQMLPGVCDQARHIHIHTLTTNIVTGLSVLICIFGVLGLLEVNVVKSHIIITLCSLYFVDYL